MFTPGVLTVRLEGSGASIGMHNLEPEDLAPQRVRQTAASRSMSSEMDGFSDDSTPKPYTVACVS